MNISDLAESEHLLKNSNLTLKRMEPFILTLFVLIAILLFLLHHCFEYGFRGDGRIQDEGINENIATLFSHYVSGPPILNPGKMY